MSELGFNAQVLKDMRDACAICIDSYDPDASSVFVGLINHCGHYFHFECLWNWLEINQTCPICRVRCDLAESDIRGLSLAHVLASVPSDPSQSGSLSNVSNAFEMIPIEPPATATDEQTPSTSAPVESYHSDSDVSDVEHTRTRIVTVASVVTQQPRSVSRTSSQNSADVATPTDEPGETSLPVETGVSNPSFD